jgi:hypothetical protein
VLSEAPVILLPIVLLSLGLLLSGSEAAPSVRIGQVAWMQGCWQAASPRRVIEEHWMAPRGGAMLGMGRTIRGDSLAEYEMVVLRESNGALAYRAHPSGQPGATFVAQEATDSTVVFSNPAHDFPQHVGYRRVGADSLAAWIEGPGDGKPRRIQFLYRRVRCPGE